MKSNNGNRIACTIEVEKKEKDEDFELKDLRLNHKECYGGNIKIRLEPTDSFTSVLPLNWEIQIKCKRCNLIAALKVEDSLVQKIQIALIKTAMDGKTRSFKDIKGDEVRIVQKISPEG